MPSSRVRDLEVFKFSVFLNFKPTPASRDNVLCDFRVRPDFSFELLEEIPCRFSSASVTSSKIFKSILYSTELFRP